MSDNVECPFCGMEVTKKEAAGFLRHPANTTCTLDDELHSEEKWKMRPPKREQPAQEQYMLSEVEYLRGLVRDLVVEKTPETVTQYIYPEHMYAQREGKEPGAEK